MRDQILLLGYIFCRTKHETFLVFNKARTMGFKYDIIITSIFKYDIIDFGHTSSAIHFIKKGKIELPRTIAVGLPPHGTENRHDSPELSIRTDYPSTQSESVLSSWRRVALVAFSF